MNADRGSATLIVLAVLGVLAVLAMAVAQLGVLVAARAQASAASDAAALAAAVATYPASGRGSPEREAAVVARLNGADLTSCDCSINGSLSARSVIVVVGVDIKVPLFGEMTVQAVSRAEFDPRRWLGR